MKKIIWIASYPKSGNTWMRFLLANYFYNHDMVFDPTIVKHITSLNFPKEISKLNERNKLDINHISKFWIPAQNNLQVHGGDVTFLKTHNANISVKGKSFTNENYTIAVIYIVRDPRDVIISSHNYFGSDYDKLINDICYDKYFTILGNIDKGNLQVLSTWDVHFNSWTQKMKRVPKIIVRYEDMIKNTEKIFRNTVNFLAKILKFQINEQKLKFSVENSKFKKLSNMEDEIGFIENGNIDKKFFRKGEVGQYKDILTKTQIDLINQKFMKEMSYLKYL